MKVKIDLGIEELEKAIEELSALVRILKIELDDREVFTEEESETIYDYVDYAIKFKAKNGLVKIQITE